MFQLYIVDDEELILKDLKNNILWIENGFEIIGTNTNPLKAMEDIFVLHPHVILTDIKMPVINGLQLIEKVRERLPDMEFVIMSAYSDFELVRSSFKLNISDYLLKPVSNEDCQEVFQHVWEKLHEKNKPLYSNYSYDRSNKKFNAILDHIEKNISQKHTLATISDQFYLSPNTVCLYFNKYLNTTFVNYLTDIRMYRAKQLLTTDLPIKEIASLCGYSDYFYFCKVFQKYYDATPTQLRKKEGSHEQ